MNKKWLPVLALIFAISLPALYASIATSYPVYSGTPACDDCHPGFLGGFGAPLHDLHNLMTSDCGKCHNVVGDNPPLENCAGCHVEAGVVLHHTNAGAPADINGIVCAVCHPGQVSVGESTPPPYYGMAGVNLTSPCETEPTLGGEDYAGNGLGLDNDGDLLYDGNDPDCQTPVRPGTWGGIKALY